MNVHEPAKVVEELDDYFWSARISKDGRGAWVGWVNGKPVVESQSRSQATLFVAAVVMSLSKKKVSE